MSRREIQATIDANPGKPLYVSYHGFTLPGGQSVGMFHDISKTRILRVARHVAAIEIGTYESFRPDLAGRVTGPDGDIVLFRIAEQS